MDDQREEASAKRPGPSARGPELGVAAVLLVLAVMVIADSLRVGIGWADDGPRSGYFPFYIGLFLLLASGSIVVSTLINWRTLTTVFAEREQLATVFAVLIPMVVYVGGIWLLGIYLASALLIGYFMRRYGKFGWPATGAVSVGVPLAFFMVFERWFLVPLPKGPLEAMLGY
jgi:putative tricarboxylic transport membrane protein